MSESKLDQVVKGAPAPGTSSPDPSRASTPSTTPTPTPDPSTADTADPISSLPSSPPQIYLNLLILEASLRSQYLTLRARRRQHTFFLLLLALWNAYFVWALFMRPREDGRGLGGSVYWVVEMAERMALMGGIVTGMLIWGTGQWERGIRWPRRWIGIANRGLRGINTKLVVIKGPWWKELISTFGFLFPYRSLFPSTDLSRYRLEHRPERSGASKRDSHGHRSSRAEDDTDWMREDLSVGGDQVKLLLLPKPFSPEFRENWELYRTEYWEKENERRGELRRRLKQLRREIAKKEGGWLWWTGWRGWRRTHESTGRAGDIERSQGQHLHPHHHPHHHRSHLDKDVKRPQHAARSGSHSRSSSRSSTPGLDLDEKHLSAKGGHSGPSGPSGNTADRRKRVKSTTSSSSVRSQKSLSDNTQASSTFSRPGLPSPLLRGNSSQSVSSGNESDRSERVLVDSRSMGRLRSEDHTV
ncbi:MAG: hypothetical protein M1817_003254 [Caeruleum heppii]|nr:MAG: hypothetical protein M1817_003254 [Caeruleum heppii]